MYIYTYVAVKKKKNYELIKGVNYWTRLIGMK